jgi:tight adherence protein B
VNTLVLGIMVFIGVAALVVGVASAFSNKGSTRVEDRLDLLTGNGSSILGRDNALKESSVLARPLDEAPALLESLLQRLGDFQRIFDQADTTLNASKLAVISAIMGVAGCVLTAALRSHPAFIPLGGIVAGVLPTGWLLFRRGRRLKRFGVQLPDAMEMMARVLRAGQSLGFGFNVVASEMGNPIGKEFGRVFDEQNLGIPVEESLHSLCDRVPNLDLKFFATAVILQRQTGGDLAEILDKIGNLIRERFRVYGQVQALTGEGRLSGVVLLGLPFVLFLAVYYMNPGYIMVLFTDPIGKKMLAVAIFMQVLGALVIRKIVNIQV